MNLKYRKTIIAGNWKMNKTLTETRAYAEAIKPMLGKHKWCEVVLCVPSVNIPGAVRLFKDTRVAIGGETCVPLRELCEALGLSVGYDQPSDTITILTHP